MTINKLKLEILKVRNGNMNENDSYELQNTLLMIILIYSKTEHPLSHILMLDDFISFYKEYEKEKNIILKFKVNIFFIIFCLSLS